MSKLKHIAVAISAISVMGVASLSFASNCPTTLSPSTAACLSNAADAAFQSNYNVDYANQGGGGMGSSRQAGNTTNAFYSAPQQQAPSFSSTSSSSSNSNNTNDSNAKSSIRWF